MNFILYVSSPSELFITLECETTWTGKLLNKSMNKSILLEQAAMIMWYEK